MLAQQGHCSPLPRWPSHGSPGRVGHSRGRTRQPAPLGEQSHGQGGRRGRGARRLGCWWCGAGHGQRCRKLLALSRPQALPRLYREVYQAARLPLPCGRTSTWAPSSQGARRGVGTKGTAWLRTQLTVPAQGRTSVGFSDVHASTQRASSGRCDQRLIPRLAWRQRPEPPRGVRRHPIQPFLLACRTGLSPPCPPFPPSTAPQLCSLCLLKAAPHPHSLCLLCSTLSPENLAVGEAATSQEQLR